ncbi:MAG: AgmX/PglI C-terminal domain-containing protein [Bdellovibrionaceae bacterium]|nr:AgmX/PglI C-terminal domain-containing protein [Pseudobdellovibrionaceae bacterium]
MPTLKITIKEDRKVVFSRKISKFPIVFGRGKQNHIAFPDTSYLSRTHGSIGFLQDKIVVVDLNSTNGIFVDNAQVPSVTFSKKGVFSAGTYVFELEEVAGELVEKNRTSSPSINTDTSELTNISKRLIGIAKRLKFEVEDSLADLDPTDITLQAVVTWGKDIFDVRQFQSFDFVVAGASPFDPISIPSLRNKIKLGKYVNNRGELSIPFGLKWRLERGGISYDSEQAIVNNFVKSSKKSIRFGLSLDDVCTIDLGNETSLHLRYVEVPRPFIPKTWIENKEVFKKAILISLGVHLLFSLVSVFSAEKIIAPEVENIPPRFAKLILEPPKMILAPPPVLPKVEDVKPPEPLPVAETKPPTPDKEEPPPPKPDLKPVAKPKPAPKDQPKPERTAKAEKMPTKVEPVKTSAQQMADSFSDMFSETETAAPIGAKNAPIKLDKNSKPGVSAKGVSIAGVAGVLKSQVGKMQVNEGNSPSVGQQVGNVGYQTSGSGKTGKRKVVSGVLGTPKLEQPTIPQGISQDQVMLVVNKYLNDIHRCYERALMENSNLTGRVEYEWKISASGSVTSSKVKRSEMSNADSLNKCVLAIFDKMKFPAAKNGQSTLANIGFPFGKL